MPFGLKNVSEALIKILEDKIKRDRAKKNKFKKHRQLCVKVSWKTWPVRH